jgi:hypothetical protein
MHAARYVLLAILFAAPVSAQSLRQTVTPPPGAIEFGPDGQLVMSSDVCATLGGNQPAVPGAAYQAGVDVDGRLVAPADLPSSAPPIQVDNFPIAIKKDLAGKFNVPATGGAYGAKAILGYVTLRDNRAYFNGQPMGEDQRAVLLDACRDAKR